MARLNLLEETRYEKLPVTVYDNQQEASVAVAQRIAKLIKSKTAKGEKTVLGLA
ncbi:MAG: glucosamine-6-phosphate deaminase, partial [Mucilaginibacter sp.]